MTSVHNSSPEGGLTIYKGKKLRGGRFSLCFLVPIGKFIGKTALKLGKSIFKKAAPKVAQAAMQTGQDVLTGKMNMRNTIRQGVKKGRRQLASSTRQALLEELRGYETKMKGSGGLMRKRNFPPKYSW